MFHERLVQAVDGATMDDNLLKADFGAWCRNQPLPEPIEEGRLERDLYHVLVIRGISPGESPWGGVVWHGVRFRS
jgi:hypothetical protein